MISLKVRKIGIPLCLLALMLISLRPALPSGGIEWGVVIKGEVEFKERPKISQNQWETGLILLKGIKVEGPYLTIRVDSGGCTDKKTIEVKVKREKSLIEGYRHYSLSFIRKIPDRCKAFFPEGIEVTYDLVKELKLKPPFTVSVKNPLSPLIPEKYFEIKPSESKIEEISEEVSLKKELIEATKRAIQSEIKRYESRIPPEKEKVEILKRELERLNNMKPEKYPLKDGKPNPPLKFGVVIPPIIKEVEIKSLPQTGKLLELTRQSKSGPFFHVAGIAKDATLNLKPDIGPPFKAKIYLIYKREYFGMIQDCYVYVEKVENM
ncbi:MAG: hypothetical protein H5T91_10240 [Synergistetes bacterium]|nr:hypothetical protein [Synergistota bacterium]